MEQVKISSKYKGLIAACGMNCGLCIGYLRDKNPCGGCFTKDDKNKPKVCRSCSIVNCEHLKLSKSGFCFECEKFPCIRLKKLDSRYKTNYRMSMLGNLEHIQLKGLDDFLIEEEIRWKCNVCGAGLSVHRNYCLSCKAFI